MARLPVPADLTIEAHEAAHGLRFCFSLPAGSYATNLLREFMRNPAADGITTKPGPNAAASAGGGADEEDEELDA